MERLIPWRHRRAEAGEPAGSDVDADPGSDAPRLPSHNMFPGVFYALLAGFLGAVASSTAKLSLGADYLKGVCETGLRTWGEQRKFRQADETSACDRVRTTERDGANYSARERRIVRGARLSLRACGNLGQGTPPPPLVPRPRAQ